ncbi:MAG: competence protein ComEC [Rhodothermaceae bacterium]|nr:MAG: competence protein ComEC [Rhodothermaceae bacterium]
MNPYTLKVTFKYVGQGDCILIEWNEENRLGIGIIDCNKINDRNVLIDYLNTIRPEVIDFIFLSHPHKDHYSGLLDVLCWCEEKEVAINLFGHTARNLNEYVKGIVVMSHEEKRTLSALFRKVRNLAKIGVIKKRGSISDLMGPYSLGTGLSMRFLAPSEKEYDTFLGTLYNPDLSMKDKPNPNYLCTVAIIETDEWCLLLTSDVEKKVMQRITHGPLRGYKKHFILGQVPHHGAKNNHYDTFWKQRNRAHDSIAAISVGENNYGHPSPEVIHKLQKNRYQVHQTWYRQKTKPEIYKISRALDLVSNKHISISLPTSSANDLAYEISAQGKIRKL